MLPTLAQSIQHIARRKSVSAHRGVTHNKSCHRSLTQAAVSGMQRDQFIEELAAIMVTVFKANQQIGTVNDMIIETAKNGIDRVWKFMLGRGLKPHIT